MPRDYYPVVPPRAFVTYRPPEPLPTRSADPRAVYEDARRFIERCTRLVVRETTVSIVVDPRATGGSADAGDAALERVVRRLAKRFGEPTLRPGPRRAFDDWSWGLPIERAGEVVDFLGGLIKERPDEASHVTVGLSWLFFLRDPVSGRTLPFQQRKYRRGRPLLPWLSLTLGQESRADVILVFPFERPDERCRQYVLALQQHSPVALDPRYFDHFAPYDDNRGFERTRLPAGWLAGEGVDVASRRPSELRPVGSGALVSALGNVVAAVAEALRTHAYRAIVVTGPNLISLSSVFERAAKAGGLQLSEVDCMMVQSPDELEPAVSRAIANLGTGPAVLVLDGVNLAFAPLRSALHDLVRTRQIGTTSLPPSLRVGVTNIVTSRATNVSAILQYRAEREGSLPDSVLRGWSTDLHVLAARDVRVTFDRWDTKAAG